MQVLLTLSNLRSKALWNGLIVGGRHQHSMCAVDVHHLPDGLACRQEVVDLDGMEHIPFSFSIVLQRTVVKTQNFTLSLAKIRLHHARLNLPCESYRGFNQSTLTATTTPTTPQALRDLRDR